MTDMVAYRGRDGIGREVSGKIWIDSDTPESEVESLVKDDILNKGWDGPKDEIEVTYQGRVPDREPPSPDDSWAIEKDRGHGFGEFDFR